MAGHRTRLKKNLKHQKRLIQEPILGAKFWLVIYAPNNVQSIFNGLGVYFFLNLLIGRSSIILVLSTL